MGRDSEEKFDCLKSGEEPVVEVGAVPKTNKIDINYRCWFPKKIL